MTGDPVPVAEVDLGPTGIVAHPRRFVAIIPGVKQRRQIRP